MANQLAMDKAQAVKHLHQAGYSERRIAEQLGISRNAVRSHLVRKGVAMEQDGPKGTKAPTGLALTGSDEPKGTKALTGSEALPGEGTKVVAQDSLSGEMGFLSASQCEPYRQVILQKLELGLTAQRIYQDLASEHGFAAKYHSVRRFVAKLSASTEPPFRRLECEPGAEMQVDFGTGARCENRDGKLIKTHVFRAILSHSRKGFSESVTRLTVESFIRVLENAFWRLGGVPKVVVFDNASCAVKHADWYDAELHPKIVEFCQHYGFALVPTRPRTPRHKGKTERGVGYVQDNGLKGKEFESLAAQNVYLDHWEATVADTRIHGTTKKHVGKLFEEVERPLLGALPCERFPFFEEGRRIVSRDGHIAVNQAYYSVAPEYVGGEVWVRWNSHTLRVLNSRMETITTHCTHEKGRFSTHAEHIVPEKIHGIEKGVEFLLKKVRFLGSHAARWAELLIEQRGVQASRSLLGLLSLSKKFSADELNRACDVAWRAKATNYRAIKRLLENSQAAAQQTLDFLDEHPIIRPVSEYGQFVRQALQGKGS